MLIDEAQTIGANDGTVNKIAMGVHSGDTGKFAVVAVFAGLPDTEKVLSQVGISRTSRGFVRLGELTQEESGQAVDGFFEKYKLDSAFAKDGSKVIRDSLVLASEGWPRHLHYYLQGLASQVVKDDTNQSIGMDLDIVLEHGHRARVKYCTSRLQGVADLDFRRAISTVAEEFPANGAIDVDTLLDRAIKNELSSKEAKFGFNQAIHCGVLEYVEGRSDEYCRFPIPSFHTFMKCGRDEAATITELRNAANKKIEQLFSY